MLRKPVTFTLRIDEDVFKHLSGLAEEQRVSVAHVVRSALLAFTGGRPASPRRTPKKSR